MTHRDLQGCEERRSHFRRDEDQARADALRVEAEERDDLAASMEDNDEDVYTAEDIAVQRDRAAELCRLADGSAARTQVCIDLDLAAMVAAMLSRDADTIEAPDAHWGTLRRAFRPSLAPEPDEDGVTRFKTKPSPSLATALVVMGKNPPSAAWDVYIHHTGGGVEVCAVTLGEDDPYAYIDLCTTEPGAEYRVGIYRPDHEEDFFSMGEVSELDLAAYISAELARAGLGEEA